MNATVPRTLLLALLVVVAAVSAQDEPAAAPKASQGQPVCSVNQLFNGQICTCAPGYFSSANKESASRCDDECEDVYDTYFTRGECVKGIFSKLPKDEQPACNLRCGMRVRIWASIAGFVVIAAAVATLVFTLPLCIATCCSCLQAKKANKNAKRVFNETQQPNKDQQMATMSYNPYAYWPYYGRA
ncbi:hypothetical protein QR680_008235 [Steinernema hermaphroditum]|uniref:EGF-like domain-containing protein n=1 Tax=Steinernema hermaphroditum TaxID=289476 RepID=A0AA39IFW0_9BILA|nr:hypothetical protein QR680_008235 [Steinernema hermaphroditum]